MGFFEDSYGEENNICEDCYKKEMKEKNKDRCRFSDGEDCTLTHYNFNCSIQCNGTLEKKGCPLWK